MRTVPIDEQEVTINIYPNQVDEYADIFSAIPYFTTRLRKLLKSHPNEMSVTEVSDGVVARVPRKWIRVTPPRQVNMSEEKRRETAERLAAHRESQKKEEVSDGHDAV